MGYSTFFNGAIKITPRMSDEQVIRINTFLSMRHHQGLDSPEVRKQLTIQAWPDIDETFKAQFIPDPEPHLENHRAIFKNRPDVHISTEMLIDIGSVPTGYSIKEYSTVQAPYFSLWSDLRLYQTPDATYLAWNESEKAYEMKKWFIFMDRVIHRLYPDVTLSGCIQAQGEDEDDEWTVEVIDNEICITDNTLCPATYTDIFRQISDSLRKSAPPAVS